MRQGLHQTVEDNLALLLKLSRNLLSEPPIVSQCIGQALLNVGSQTLRYALEEGTPTADYMRAWSDQLAPYADPIPMEQGMLCEWVWVNHAFASDPSGYLYAYNFQEKPTTIPISKRISVEAYDMSGLLLLDQLAYLEIQTSMYDMYLLPYPEWEAVRKIIEAQINDLPRHRILSRAATAESSRTMTLPLMTSANIRSTLAALAVEQYRLDHGTFPRSLDLLVPDYLESVPEDPFTGTDLIYRAEESGYVIYSVGRDGNDNGGIDRDPRTRVAWDIVFRVDKGER